MPDNSFVVNPSFPLDTLPLFPTKEIEVTVELDSTAGPHETTFTFTSGLEIVTKTFVYDVFVPVPVPVPVFVPVPVPAPVPTPAPVPVPVFISTPIMTSASTGSIRQSCTFSIYGTDFLLAQISSIDIRGTDNLSPDPNLLRSTACTFSVISDTEIQVTVGNINDGYYRNWSVPGSGIVLTTPLGEFISTAPPTPVNFGVNVLYTIQASNVIGDLNSPSPALLTIEGIGFTSSRCGNNIITYRFQEIDATEHFVPITVINANTAQVMKPNLPSGYSNSGFSILNMSTCTEIISYINNAAPIC